MANNEYLKGTSWPWSSVPIDAQEDDVIAVGVARLIGTSRKERKMNNAFGSGVFLLVFENKGRAFEALIRREVIAAIQNYFPRVKLSKIDIRYSEKDNEADAVIIDYEYKGVQKKGVVVNF
jgi:phage baseplate assembly protein W